MVPVEESSITFLIICVLQPDLHKENWLYPEVELIKGIQMILEAWPRALNDK
ncbi:hypothetical protein Tco_0406106, partial [Tanacetum coccineum]